MKAKRNLIQICLAVRLLALLLLSMLPAAGYAQFNYTVNCNNPECTSPTVSITKYTGSGGPVTISNMMYVSGWGNLPVVSIGDSAFLNGTMITSVMIGTNVTTIGSEAFDGCIGLTNITIPNNVTNIGDYAFGQCTSLANFTLGTNITSIGNYEFWDCIKLTSVTIPNTVTNIGYDAFFFCTKLASITISTNITSIGTSAFSGCPSLTGVYCQGNSPTPNNDLSVFSGDTNGIVYYLPETAGWVTLFDGLPTMLLSPFSISGGSIKIQSNQLFFAITSITNEDIVIEGCTNLASHVWIPLATNSLTIGTNYFSDPHWTNYSGRYYRLRSP